MSRKIYAVFVAGGSGTRMGASLPKQFLTLGGIPVLQRTINRFVDAIPDLKVITVLPKQHFDTWKELCRRYDFNVAQQLVEGGLTRFHSVRNALEKIDDPDAVVMIHDGVRPLVSEKLLHLLVSSAEKGAALCPVVPVTDTLRCINAEEATPDRSKLDAVQTPQLFIASDIKAAYSLAYDTAFTDDVSVALQSGMRVKRIPGERYNIKLTTPEDMFVAELIIGACLPDGSLCEPKK